MSQYPNEEIIPINVDTLGLNDLIAQAEKLQNFLKEATNNPGSVQWSETMKWQLYNREDFIKELNLLLNNAKKGADVEERIREMLSQAQTWYCRNAEFYTSSKRK